MSQNNNLINRQEESVHDKIFKLCEILSDNVPQISLAKANRLVGFDKIFNLDAEREMPREGKMRLWYRILWTRVELCREGKRLPGELIQLLVIRLDLGETLKKVPAVYDIINSFPYFIEKEFHLPPVKEVKFKLFLYEIHKYIANDEQKRCAFFITTNENPTSTGHCHQLTVYDILCRIHAVCRSYTETCKTYAHIFSRMNILASIRELFANADEETTTFCTQLTTDVQLTLL